MSSTRVKALGTQCGFDLVRITEASDMHVERGRYLEWIASGRHAEMKWITDERAVRSSSPGSLLPGALSVISVGLSYWAGHRSRETPSSGRIARYAWGHDYHTVMGTRLEQFVTMLQAEFGGDHRWYVDTGPAMDRALAARSGLGWYGKNTNVLTEKFGSFVLLGEIITTLSIAPDRTLDRDCGSCRLCVIACPTGALGPEYALDSRKCISYLTIEHRGPIPLELRPLMGSWVFGCDICQDVCPPTMRPHLAGEGQRRAWGGVLRKQLSGADITYTEESPSIDRKPGHSEALFNGGVTQSVPLDWLLSMSHDEYLEAFRGTAVRRAKAWMLRRNAAIALGNVGDESSIPALANALRQDEHPVVRSHAAWALGRLTERLHNGSACEILTSAQANESDPDVSAEIEAALSTSATSRSWDATGLVEPNGS